MSSRKEVATAFLRHAATGDVRTAYDEYVSPRFRHHNPSFHGDAGSLSEAMEENASQFPEKTIDIEHAIEEADFVAVHSRVRLHPQGPEIATVHIFRFDADDRVVELWDIGQPVPNDSPNENGMF